MKKQLVTLSLLCATLVGTVSCAEIAEGAVHAGHDAGSMHDAADRYNRQIETNEQHAQRNQELQQYSHDIQEHGQAYEDDVRTMVDEHNELVNKHEQTKRELRTMHVENHSIRTSINREDNVHTRKTLEDGLDTHNRRLEEKRREFEEQKWQLDQSMHDINTAHEDYKKYSEEYRVSPDQKKFLTRLNGIRDQLKLEGSFKPDSDFGKKVKLHNQELDLLIQHEKITQETLRTLDDLVNQVKKMERDPEPGEMGLKDMFSKLFKRLSEWYHNARLNGTQKALTKTADRIREIDAQLDNADGTQAEHLKTEQATLEKKREQLAKDARHHRAEAAMAKSDIMYLDQHAAGVLPEVDVHSGKALVRQLSVIADQHVDVVRETNMAREKYSTQEATPPSPPEHTHVDADVPPTPVAHDDADRTPAPPSRTSSTSSVASDSRSIDSEGPPSAPPSTDSTVAVEGEGGDDDARTHSASDAHNAHDSADTPRSALLEGIRKGVQLRTVEAKPAGARSGPGDAETGDGTGGTSEGGSMSDHIDKMMKQVGTPARLNSVTSTDSTWSNSDNDYSDSES